MKRMIGNLLAAVSVLLMILLVTVHLLITGTFAVLVKA